MSKRVSPEVIPDDVYNADLISNVHPPDWQNPKPASCYNLVVIGAGTAGLVTAAGATALGARVAIVERHLMGGDCLNFGCVPSKCLIRSSRVYAELRAANEFGFRTFNGAESDFPGVMKRMRQIRARISHHDSAKRFQEMGVDVFLGEGRFLGPAMAEVAGTTLRFKKAVIATGTRPLQPHIEGLVETGFLTNETVFSLTERPRRLAVIGGGPIGCELAQTFQRLGCEVTMLHKHSRILNREDSEAAEIIQQAFLRDGIRLILDCHIKGVEKKNGNKVIHLEYREKEDRLAVDEILLGVGRIPNLETLNLDLAGVKYGNRKGVVVNDYLQTTNPSIYAAGDICQPHKFTHMADATARLVIQNALFFGRKKMSALTIPWCTYTDPEIAHVGMYENEARTRGIEVDTFTRQLSDVDRAIVDGQEDGMVKILIKKGTDKILGATVVARHAGDMISEITLAMVGKLGLRTIMNVIHPYPTQAEAIRQCADIYNRTRLKPFIKKMLSLWFRLNL